MEARVKVHALHGFLGLPSDWDFLKERLPKERFEIAAWDIFKVLPPRAGADLCEWARRFNDSVRSQESGPRVLLGYSMGGRLALHALLDSPELWGAAVIVSANPGIADHGPRDSEREDRVRFDEAWAQRFETEDWARLIQDWEAQPVFGSRPNPLPRRRELEHSREDLAGALRAWSLGKQENLLPRLTELQLPVLWVAGEGDPKYAAIARSFFDAGRESWISSVAAHRVPWEDPQEFLMRFRGFTERFF